ncbi:class I SAM-dependent methyltransferase [Ramlibacter ginsenosidimutans]|uniref:Class I SAM-dependent methyltransferase n=1 Tax=Ramlibacter ginsenosidimutans TaxID=502333 RepID=A0A934TQ15_9BURK|nr:class I SAM-dependent methyltransferase [Ramlibacter ginsenosidimutans]MBK6004567.1 class I SAM-dependent methyltransferase [Ramlibacter ginsenosidimutans]
MRAALRSIVNHRWFQSTFARNRGVIDWLFSYSIIPAAYLLLAYRRLGAGDLPRTTTRLRDIGVFPIRNHYYEPLFDHRQLAAPSQEGRRLPGLDLNVPGQLAFLQQLRCADELRALRLQEPGDGVASFCIVNDTFPSGDADFLYQFLRQVKPAKVVEVGSGNSTKLARLALQKNQAETGQAAQHICIEPYEQPWLEQLEGVKVVRKRVEDCGIDWASELNAGDLLFIDSSHVIRPQGDVVTEYLEILPLLQPGVYVHIHDIFTPRDYLPYWLAQHVRFWNEQYLLEALLTNTTRYQVVAALNYLTHNHYEEMSRVCPYLTPEHEPSSFYFRVAA